MDYPHPQFELKDGNIEFVNAYDSGIGEWDKVTVKYSYSDVPKGMKEREYLNSVLEEARLDGLKFITDSDARPAGGAHAFAHLWDNGKDAADELKRVLKIRQKAIENFSEDNIRMNEPYSVLEDVFVPLYFFHRYQTEAAVKMIGGLQYNYAVKGGGYDRVEHLDEKLQKKALESVLSTLTAEELAIPENKLKLFPPRAFGYARDRESFKSNTDVAFDALGAPATASDMSLRLLLHPARAERLIQQNALKKDLPGLEYVLDELISNTIKNVKGSDYEVAVQKTINFVVFKHLLNLAINKDSTPMVKAITNAKIDGLANWLRGEDDAVYREMYRNIQMFREKPQEFELELNVPEIPDGSPIGN